MAAVLASASRLPRAAVSSAVITAVMICGCTEVPVAPQRSPAPVPPPVPKVIAAPTATATPPSTYELRLRERATAFEKAQQWQDAALTWEILRLLNARNEDYVTGHANALQEVRDRAQEHWQKGSLMEKEGKRDQALSQYLKCLAIDPTHHGARTAMRRLVALKATPSGLLDPQLQRPTTSR